MLLQDDIALPIDQLGAFLARERPRLGDILATACELYRVNPDWLGEPGDDRAMPAREMFVYCAKQWAGCDYSHAGELVGLPPWKSCRLMAAFRRRLTENDILRDDFELVAVRLTECVLRQRRYL